MNSSTEQVEIQPTEVQEAPLYIMTLNANKDWISGLLKQSKLELLSEIDLSNVQEHAAEDTDFETINFKMASATIKMAEETEADVLFLANRQQSRLGLAARKSAEGHFQLLTSNQIALLLCEILLEQTTSQEERKSLLLIHSVVSSGVLESQASYWQVKSIQTYSGQESLSQAIEEQTTQEVMVAVDEQNHIVFPGLSQQESLQKALSLLAEKAFDLKQEGQTLHDHLLTLFKRYGFYSEKSFCISKEDKHGQQQIQNSMRTLRQKPVDSLFEQPVRTIIDFQKRTYGNLLTGRKGKIDLPKAAVLQFVFTDNSKITFEANDDNSKITYHISVNDRLMSKEDFDEVKSNANKRMLNIMGKIGKI
jgi:phosphoglucomutase